MKLAEWLTIIAIVLGPITAIQVSEFLQQNREKKSRRVELFRPLMTTRKARLAGTHVQALNLIDIEFHGERRIQEAWAAYLDHLSVKGQAPDVWNNKLDDLFAELLYEMSRTLKFGFDRTHIKRASYLPQAYGDTDEENAAIRKALVAILGGNRGFPIEIVAPSEPAMAAEKGRLTLALGRVVSGESAIRVKIVPADGETAIDDPARP